MIIEVKRPVPLWLQYYGGWDSKRRAETDGAGYAKYVEPALYYTYYSGPWFINVPDAEWEVHNQPTHNEWGEVAP